MNILNSIVEESLSDDNQDIILEMDNLSCESEKVIHKLETAAMFKKKEDSYFAYMDIQSGSGGTEAQDWVAMLLRMYTKWIESHGFHQRS